MKELKVMEIYLLLRQVIWDTTYIMRILIILSKTTVNSPTV